MTRTTAVVVAVLTVVASAAAGVGAWWLVREPDGQLPQISVYSHGESARVGPYWYCDVLDLTDCEEPQEMAELPVSGRNPVQLGVPAAIGRAPWRLLQVYEAGEISTVFRPDTRLAVTIPTVDAHRGRLTGIAVQLMTMVAFPDGELGRAPHAEWSVATVWQEWADWSGADDAAATAYVPAAPTAPSSPASTAE